MAEVAQKLTPEEEKQSIRDIYVAAEAQTEAGDTFYLITQRYGGGPVLTRKVISTGLLQTELAVEVYPLRLQLHLMPKGVSSITRISKKETIGKLHQRACEIFDLTMEQVYIWDYFSLRKHALMSDMEKTLDVQMCKWIRISADSCFVWKREWCY